ncbi:MAG: HAMP domain-containing histidine kinase [Dehalococcoidia bacterium]|nr:MAG: HAMP domain-containing histidine kinase [Dehalococcoidia bacterium]
MFRSVRSRLIASFALIVAITLAAAAIALFARIGGYREQLDASTLRTTAAPVYYNLTYFPDALRVEPASGRRLRTELTSYLKAQAQDTGVIVLLVDAQGNVIQDAISDERLAGAHFEVPAPPPRGPDFKQLPEHKLQVDGRTLTYVIVPTPKVIRLQQPGVAAIVVALPETSARDAFRDLAPRLLFAGIIGLAVALIAALVLWAWIYRPLGRITKGVRAVAGGDYRQRVPVSGPAEIREVARDVNAMADSVQVSQRALREFLANVSHELRTPLTSIRGFSQALLDGTLDTPEERERAARVIDIESRRLLHLVGELLDLSRIESGQQAMQTADVPAAELLAHVRDVFSIRAEEAHVDLRIGDAGDAVVNADFDRIEQVLGNLLDNAFRHTRDAGRIEVGLRPPRAGFVEFFVSDSGGGIAPDELPHVFDRFYRSSGETSGTGAGLGLAISREIVRAHGGEIRVESSATTGTTFSFTLPLAGRHLPSRAGGRPVQAAPPGELPATGGG